MKAAVASYKLYVQKMFTCMPKHGLHTVQGSPQDYNRPFAQAMITKVCTVASVTFPAVILSLYVCALDKTPPLTCIFLRLGKSPGEI